MSAVKNCQQIRRRLTADLGRSELGLARVGRPLDTRTTGSGGKYSFTRTAILVSFWRFRARPLLLLYAVAS